MDANKLWETVHAERRSLANDLQSVEPDRWTTPSWSSQWTVEQALAHMTSTATLSAGSFFPQFLGVGFNIGRLNEKGIKEKTGANPTETLANFEAIVTSTKHPPGPKDTMLGEVIVHAEDIRRPLNIAHDYPADAMTHVADFFKKSNLVIGSKRRIAGITLKATDTEWFWGSGPEVIGPMLSILLALTGRKGALDDLSGDGIAIMRERP